MLVWIKILCLNFSAENAYNMACLAVRRCHVRNTNRVLWAHWSSGSANPIHCNDCKIEFVTGMLVVSKEAEFLNAFFSTDAK